MSKAKYLTEEILFSIQKLPPDSVGELLNFLEYLQFKNSSQSNQNSQNLQQSQKKLETKITPEQSEQIIEEILTEIGEDLPSLSDYAVSRAGIYEDHL
jgi:hypothetical protein